MQSAERRSPAPRGTPLVVAGLLALAGVASAQPIPAPPPACDKPVYLTFDTGHMGVAPLVAEVLQRQQVRVTFFAPAEKTQTGGDSLDNQWAPGWRARAAEGHAFASHTQNHVYWLGDERTVEPRANYAVLRAQQDLNNGNMGFSLIGTAVNRSPIAGSAPGAGFSTCAIRSTSA